MSEPPRGDFSVNDSSFSNSNLAAHNIISGDLKQYTNIYQSVPTLPIDEAILRVGRERFAALPLDRVPDHAPIPPQSRVAHRQMAHFVGREAELQQLARIMAERATAAITPTAATTGLGGVGKTSLATEFVHRYGQFFAGGVFWLSCADPTNIPSEIAQCGGADCLNVYTEAMGLPLVEQMQRVLGAWKSPLPRLLVFDNCEDPQILRDLRPTTGGCRVLVTSRNTTWSANDGVQVAPLGVLSAAESVALLQRLAPHVADADAQAIAVELGRLPLALHLAGSFLASYRSVTPAAFLGNCATPNCSNTQH